MFKNRYFILGLGLGFLLCGSMLIFFGWNYISVNPTELTVEELKVIGNEKNLYIYTEEELNAFINQSNSKEDKVINDKKNENLDEEESINFTIPYGLDSFEVAELLYDNGVLDNKQEFNKILVNNYLTKGIIAGEYEFSQSLSIQELIELITKTKITN